MLGRLFQADPDLRLAGTEIYLDPAEPRPVGLVSHGHSDHIGRHGRFLATPATASFLRLRLGADLAGTELAFGRQITLDGFDIELFPAGHILGSAMILIRRGGESLLYTGDFRLRPSWTAEPAIVPRADAVIMESTYGSPKWKFPSREELGQRLLELVHAISERRRLPVLLAYSLGKAQEVTRFLTSSGVEVAVHPAVAAMNDLYEKHGVALGAYRIWTDQGRLFGAAAANGPSWSGSGSPRVLIIPPHLDRDLRRIRNKETVSLTGWALFGDYRLRADHSLPLSDHADFDELLELVERAGPRVVYVTHGSAAFARELRTRGIRAEYLRKKPQMRLF